MNPDFIRVKSLEGELKLSQMKRGLGCTITTKEIILQKPHYSYQIQLKDIISMVPYSIKPRDITFSHQSSSEEQVKASFGSHYYKISADKVKIYNRSGVVDKGQTDFIVPLNTRFLEQVAEHSNLMLIL